MVNNYEMQYIDNKLQNVMKVILGIVISRCQERTVLVLKLVAKVVFVQAASVCRDNHDTDSGS